MNSYWNEFEMERKYPKLTQDITADVAIIGGGLTGIQTAYYLQNKGYKVVVLEKDKICSGTSGGSTGKITSQHGLLYNYLENSNGINFAKKYYEANEEAKENISKIIEKEKIECDFERKKSYVFTEVEDEVLKIQKEVESTKKVGANSEFVTQIDLPIDVFGAIRFDNQAEFDPVKYCYGLTKIIIKNGGEIYENSKVIETVEDDGKYNIITKEGMVKAKYMLITTRYPIIRFPGYYFLKMYQSTSYAILVDTHTDLNLDGYYINEENPKLSFRTAKSGDKNLLLVVGYIGDFSDIMDNCFVATGFNKWGITASNIAAKIITDKIIGKTNPYEEIFESSRLGIIKNKDEVMNMLKEAGEGIILERIKGKPTPTCTHLGCKLSWNPLEEIWECSCHGSKFTKRGFVIEGPAVKDLDKE